MSLAVAIQMDHVSSIDIDADSTFMLAMEAQERGHGLFHYEPDDLVFRDGRLFARAQPMEVKREKGKHYSLGAAEMLDLASVDIIQRASPFDEFPAAMAEEYDKVAFEYKFLFAERLVPRD